MPTEEVYIQILSTQGTWVYLSTQVGYYYPTFWL